MVIMKILYTKLYFYEPYHWCTDYIYTEDYWYRGIILDTNGVKLGIPRKIGSMMNDKYWGSDNDES